jgi:hypothetical protein
VGVAVGVAVLVGLGVLDTVGVGVAVNDGVCVGVRETVIVGVIVYVSVGVNDGVKVCVGVAVGRAFIKGCLFPKSNHPFKFLEFVVFKYKKEPVAASVSPISLSVK